MAEPLPRPSALQLIAAVPFVVFLFILPFPGTVALRLICLIAACVVAAIHWRRLASLPLRWPILLWAGVVLLSLLTAVDPQYSWREIKNEVGYCLLAFAAFFAWTRGRRELAIGCVTLSVAFVAIALGALADQARGGAWPAGAFYGGSGAIAMYLVTAAPVLLVAGAVCWPRHALPWACGLAVLLLMVVAMNGQRVLWPVLGLQSLLFALWLWWRSGVRASRLLSGNAALLAVLAAGFYWNYQGRPGAELEHDPRPAVWAKAGERILQQPLIGAGFGRRAMTKAYPDLVPKDFPLMWHAHNLVLNYGISAGIPGMVAILLLFGAFGSKFWQLAQRGEPLDRLVALAGAAMVLGVFGRNTVNDFFVRDGALLFWALAGMLLGYLLRQQAAEDKA